MFYTVSMRKDLLRQINHMFLQTFLSAGCKKIPYTDMLQRDGKVKI
jgi:hypothetical protein